MIRFVQGLAIVSGIAIAVFSLGAATENNPTQFPPLRALAALLFGDPGQSDKISHFLAYTVFSFFALLGVSYRRGLISVGVVGALIFYGFALEGLQMIRPDRVPSGADLLANCLGVATGLALSWGALRWNRHRGQIS
ncbi:hypothetical protein PB2503_07759 [Parvularcula bermudensis HTCC2503]|uniref:VanZ-like domain-containing protein n=1 Tax=Parvularcula bermudensis (strain ATCC BAA-594 / HTCC2503 / KCTC 12087) TaxID=314260 RepID=E0TGI8_PARBH|nr:VanZ family protein [Parvularcula bermudensis]ADM09607.1 hypothetical protein PB2503_07759 [Parvularcula bermudensis HTCC2503]